MCARMLRLGTAVQRIRVRSLLAMVSRQSSGAPHLHSEAAVKAAEIEFKKVCVISATTLVSVLGSVLILALTAKDIAMISKSGSAEEQETLKKTE